MIYDFTDPIFAWGGWHVVKWVFGTLCCVAIVYAIIDFNNGQLIERYINSCISNHKITIVWPSFQFL